MPGGFAESGPGLRRTFALPTKPVEHRSKLSRKVRTTMLPVIATCDRFRCAETDNQVPSHSCPGDHLPGDPHSTHLGIGYLRSFVEYIPIETEKKAYKVINLCKVHQLDAEGRYLLVCALHACVSD